MKQIKDLFLPYEDCLKLKQLGFNDECFTFYNNGILDLENMHKWLYCTNQDTFSESKNCTAPTYEQFFHWLREIHNIDAWVQPFMNEKKNGLYIIPYLPDESYSYYIFKDGIYVSDKCDLLDFEEAQLELVKEIIERLENHLK